MNWKHPKGYDITGVIRGSNYSSKAFFVIKTEKGIGWVNLGYLDHWNSSNPSHQLDGILTKESSNSIVFKSNENDFELLIKESETDAMANSFAEFTAPYQGDYVGYRPYKFTYEEQYQYAHDNFYNKVRRK
jgi:hypothetical protein